MSEVRFDDVKRHQQPVGYVHALLNDDGEPEATHRLFTSKDEAMRHGEQTSPGRKPAVVALHGEPDTATCVLVMKPGQKYKCNNVVWRVLGVNSDRRMIATNDEGQSHEFPLESLADAILTGHIQFVTKKGGK